MKKFRSDKLREECGIFGVSNHEDASALVTLGLHALQHRGQEGCGIVSFDNKNFYSEKRLGLVGDNFTKGKVIEKLPGDCAIGHNRYSTAGNNLIKNIQPFFADLHMGGLSVAHNGNLTNALLLRDILVKEGAIFRTTSDTETIVQLIAKSKRDKIVDKLKMFGEGVGNLVVYYYIILHISIYILHIFLFQLIMDGLQTFYKDNVSQYTDSLLTKEAAYVAGGTAVFLYMLGPERRTYLLLKTILSCTEVPKALVQAIRRRAKGHATELLKDTTNPIVPANGYFVDMRFGKPFTDKEKFTKIFNEMTKEAGCPPEFTELLFPETGTIPGGISDEIVPKCKYLIIYYIDFF